MAPHPTTEDHARVSAATTPPAAPCSLMEMETRFLCFFSFDRGRVEEASAALRGDSLDSPKGRSRFLWECSKPHELYEDEYLDPVARFLFPGTDSGVDAGIAAGCTYLTVGKAEAERWFSRTAVSLHIPPHDNFPKSEQQLGVSCLGIEIFLSPQGVGVLSLILSADAIAEMNRRDDWKHAFLVAQQFNYHLAQFRRNKITLLAKYSPRNDPAVWANMPLVDRENTPILPDEKADVDYRIGVAGASFNLQELVQRLLRPLKPYGWVSGPKELSVYTVVRLGPDSNLAESSWKLDLGDAVTREPLEHFIFALAQVEEAQHPGSLAGVPNCLLNRRHWAAVGILGAAHFVADQGVPFDNVRLRNVRDKYFIAYLMALLQRLALNRAIDEAATILMSANPVVAQTLAKLRAELLSFAVGGQFTQVSHRHVLQRYYRVARKGLEVPRTWSDVRHALGDIDANFSAEQQQAVAAGVVQNMQIITNVQKVVHIIEYLLAVVYAAHLWHMFADKNEFLSARVFNVADTDAQEWHNIVSFGTIAAGILGAVFVWVVNWLIHRSGDYPCRQSSKH